MCCGLWRQIPKYILKHCGRWYFPKHSHRITYPICFSRKLPLTHQEEESNSPPLETGWVSDSPVTNRVHSSHAVCLQGEILMASSVLPWELYPLARALKLPCCEEAQTLLHGKTTWLCGGEVPSHPPAAPALSCPSSSHHPTTAAWEAQIYQSSPSPFPIPQKLWEIIKMTVVLSTASVVLVDFYLL